MGGKGWFHRVMHFTTMLENCLELSRSLTILELFLCFLMLTVLPGDNHRFNSVEHPGIVCDIQRESNGVAILLL